MMIMAATLMQQAAVPSIAAIRCYLILVPSEGQTIHLQGVVAACTTKACAPPMGYPLDMTSQHDHNHPDAVCIVRNINSAVKGCLAGRARWRQQAAPPHLPPPPNPNTRPL